MRIFIGRYGHEGNGFSSQVLSFRDYQRRSNWIHGQALIDTHRDSCSYLGGIIDEGHRHNVELFPSLSCGCAAPTLSRECVNKTIEVIVQDLKQACATGLDGVCFSLHGAGCAEDIDDLEDYVLSKFRTIVGKEMPICVPLDLHGNITNSMASKAALFGIKKNPHLDCRETGTLAMSACIESILSGRKLYTSCIQLPLIIPPTAGYTENPPFLEIDAYFKQYKQSNQLVDATFFHGFPFCDQAKMGASVVVVSWEEPTIHAKKLAAYVWEKRHYFVVEPLSASAAMDKAEACQRNGYIIINKSSDNPGGGAPGDGTHLLRELLQRNLPGSLFCYIYDRQAVQEISRYSIGDVIEVTIGGKTEPLHGNPIHLPEACIISMSDGEYVTASPMEPGKKASIGQCARLRVGNTEIIIGSKLQQVYDDRPMIATGVDLSQYRYICIKSTNHFKAYFKERAADIVPCDSLGIHSCDLSSLPFTKIRRPMFPIDANVQFNPFVK